MDTGIQDHWSYSLYLNGTKQSASYFHTDLLFEIDEDTNEVVAFIVLLSVIRDEHSSNI